jgi:hypothetical protein
MHPPQFVAAAHMALALFEPPGPVAEPGLQYPVPEILELLFCVYYLLDCWLWWRGWGSPCGKELHQALARHKWRGIVVFSAFAIFTNSVIALSLPGAYRHRWLRFVFLIARSSDLQTITNSVLRSLWQVLRVSVLMVFVVLIFSVVGFSE